MKKYGFYIAALLILSLVASRAMAQGNMYKDTYHCDTIRIHDTLYRPVPAYQSFDTAAAMIQLKSGKLEPGYAVMMAFTVNGKPVNQPTFHVALDRRKRVIDPKRIHTIR